jgi:hypothetical protein
MGCRNAIAPSGGAYRPRIPRASPLYQCVARHAEELRAAGRLERLVEEQTIDRFVGCGDPHHGFARIRCEACGHDYLLAFSCKTRYFCPSCHQKRVLLYGEWVEENVLAPVAHRQYVFTVPRLLRPLFSRHRAWLGDLRGTARSDVRLAPEGKTGPLPRLAGFSVHNQVRVGPEDAEGRKKLAGYMLRTPLSLAKMTYDPASATVIYRSKIHLGLKRNFQVMSGAEWLELLCKHIPERYEQLVRYCGWYSSRSRGIRKAKGACLVAALGAATEPLGQYASRAKAAWARLIRKVYEADSSWNARSARARCGSSRRSKTRP